MFRYNLPLRDGLTVDSPLLTVLNHFQAHVAFVVSFFSVDHREDTYGLPQNYIFMFLIFALIAWAVWHGWSYLPSSVQRHSQIGVIVNVPLFVGFCQPGEWRDLGFLYIVLFFVIAINTSDAFGLPFPVRITSGLKVGRLQPEKIVIES